ncbi:MAG TPA: hypothetical protein VN137_01460 [Sphingomonas sp.]|nr:hypothetical protein [Sphingomonas sp.]
MASILAAVREERRKHPIAKIRRHGFASTQRASDLNAQVSAGTTIELNMTAAHNAPFHEPPEAMKITENQTAYAMVNWVIVGRKIIATPIGTTMHPNAMRIIVSIVDTQSRV